ncbi:hypothetical protein BJ944DRAFT_290008 [Cunninghamella echinulata]|nr:hypothetical protein BJ944DRAFT_290008 [Cunninghamella echinulata]
MAHNFEDCSLRSSSLLIVDSKTQKILLVTKEICSLLGFLPSQVIRHNLAILNLQYIHEHRYVLRHDTSHSLIALDVCIHHEHILGLDYWFLKPISTSLLFSNINNNNNSVNNNNHTDSTVSNINILRLNPYGCIEYTTLSGKEEKEYILGKSLKSLIHKDDQQRLLDGLNERQTTYQVLYLRWKTKDKNETIKDTVTDGDNDDDAITDNDDKNKNKNNNDTYKWISLTMMTVPRRRSYGAQHEDLARQLCIIRPMIDPHMITQQQHHPFTSPHPHNNLNNNPNNATSLLYHLLSFSPSSSLSSSSSSLSSNPFLSKCYIWLFYSYQIMISLFGYWIGLMVEGWWHICDIYNKGQTYMIEFLGHLLISLLDFLADCIDPAPSSTSSVRVVLGHHCHQQEKEKEKEIKDVFLSNTTTEVPWFRPLHRKRWATAVRTLRKYVQSNTMAQKSLGVLETLGVVQSSSMFDYLEKVTSEHYHHHPSSTTATTHHQPSLNDKTN